MSSPLSLGGGTSCLDGRGRPRRAGAAATAAAITAAVVMVVMTAAATLRAAPATPGRTAIPSVIRVVTAATVRAAAANASADPITQAWEAHLREWAIDSLPPLPSADLFRRLDGLLTLYAGRGLAAGQVLLEVPESHIEVPFALAAESIARDAGSRAEPRRTDLLWSSPDRVYAFRLAPDSSPPTLELYRPPMSERSVDPDSIPGQ